VCATYMVLPILLIVITLSCSWVMLRTVPRNSMWLLELVEENRTFLRFQEHGRPQWAVVCVRGHWGRGGRSGTGGMPNYADMRLACGQEGSLLLVIANKNTVSPWLSPKRYGV